ncbi:phage tail protein [Pseudomonas sp. MAG733B]|uniref:phage tail-collar fiber domain-containing protein n=1 Tax=Pseudomonas sp. MAG733B TaxID=3122079 RepID=UPI0030D4106F
MIDANSQFFAILTNVGLAKQANADALGIPWKITDMGLGDANLAGVADPPNPVPSSTQTKLINEWRRRPLNQLKIDPANPAIIIAEQIIPADEGGRWIREIGLYDEAGDLVAVANCAPSYKPLLSQGSGRTQVVRMNFIVNNAGNITLKIDPAVVLASRAYVDAAILEVLPANKTAGEFTRVKVNNRGVVVSGDNPNTLAGMGISDSYTKTEIEAMIAQASALPVGAQVSFPVNKVPPGFLERDGSVKSITAFPDLATFLGGAFNRGDEGAGNFRLPESRGEFERGWDHGRGVDAGRAVGSGQKGSVHSFDIGGGVGTVGDRSGVVPITAANARADLGYDAGSAADYPSGQMVTQSAGLTSVLVDTAEVAFGVGRPRNVAVVMCIKAWNAPINQGNIDIAALVVLASQATEINQGTAKIATQALTDAGMDDATIVTPKKMRFGFQFIKGVNGAIVLPTWLGGFIIQWGTTPDIANSASGTFNYTIPFPTAAVCAGAIRRGTGNNSATVGTTLSQISIGNRPHYTPDVSGTANAYFFFCFGY